MLQRHSQFFIAPCAALSVRRPQGVGLLRARPYERSGEPSQRPPSPNRLLPFPTCNCRCHRAGIRSPAGGPQPRTANCASACAQLQEQTARRDAIASLPLSQMGPSGSGKTTLLDLLAGRKTAGRIEVRRALLLAARTPSWCSVAVCAPGSPTVCIPPRDPRRESASL
jgi:hypothetical protein